VLALLGPSRLWEVDVVAHAINWLETPDAGSIQADSTHSFGTTRGAPRWADSELARMRAGKIGIGISHFRASWPHLSVMAILPERPDSRAEAQQEGGCHEEAIGTAGQGRPAGQAICILLACPVWAEAAGRYCQKPLA